MKYWFDTEFIERGGGEPLRFLSIGIVAEDGREFYYENPLARRLVCEDYVRFADPWLICNVLPHLKGQQRDERSRPDFEIQHFCDSAKFGTPEFWAYYADYDWVVLCQLFGRMIHLPKGWPMYCRDLKQLLDERDIRVTPQDPSGEHDALNDARWTKKAWHEAMAVEP